MEYNHWVLIFVIVMSIIFLVAVYRTLGLVHRIRMELLQKRQDHEMKIIDKQHQQKKEWDETVYRRLQISKDDDWVKSTIDMVLAKKVTVSQEDMRIILELSESLRKVCSSEKILSDGSVKQPSKQK